MPRPKRLESDHRASRPRAKTLEGREQQLIAKAVDLAERQIEEGTASAQVITHYLKLGTTRERLEQEQLRRRNALLEAQAEQIASSQRSEELFDKALKAMRSYKGEELEDEYGD